MFPSMETFVVVWFLSVGTRWSSCAPAPNAGAAVSVQSKRPTIVRILSPPVFVVCQHRSTRRRPVFPYRATRAPAASAWSFAIPRWCRVRSHRPLPQVLATPFPRRNVLSVADPCIPPNSPGFTSVFREQHLEPAFSVIAGLAPRAEPFPVLDRDRIDSATLPRIVPVSVLVQYSTVRFVLFLNIPFAAHVRRTGNFRGFSPDLFRGTCPQRERGKQIHQDIVIAERAANPADNHEYRW